MRSIRAIIASITAASFVSACVGTELNVSSNHPGSASARVGRLPESTALRSDFDDHGAHAPSASDAHERAASHDHGGGASDAAEGAADAPAAARYTCPMHPEVDRAEAGQCPKCGMRLVPKKEEK